MVDGESKIPNLKSKIATVQVPDATTRQARRLLADFAAFSRRCYPGTRLRKYQVEAAAPILAAVDARAGGAFVVLFSRQAGKDELLAQLGAFLLARWRQHGGALVLAAPTFKPQCLVSRRRLTERLHPVLHPGARTADGYRVVCGRAGVTFLSGEPAANVRGETAGLLLVANEAQDLQCDIWDSRFAPMTASTNAPSVYSGTPWAAGSLLSREMARASEHSVLSPQSSVLFRADWQRVADELPAYGEHVRGRIAQLGARHPFIRSEYCLEELDAAGGLFDAHRQAQMHGTHPRQTQPTPGRTYALLLDVGGADEDAPAPGTAPARERRHDSTALTVVEIDLGPVQDPLVRKPAYRVVDRRLWTGERHSALLPTLLDLARAVWHARYLVIDATGIGAGLASLLAAALGPGSGSARPVEVVPFVFSGPSKSALGWAFLGAVESGRYKEYTPDGAADTGLFWAQVAACTYTVEPGPGKLLRWSVPEARGHDDLLVSAALVGALDGRDWRPRAATGRTRDDRV